MTPSLTRQTCRPARQRLSLTARILRAVELTRQRRQLAQLDPHLLDDIGLSRNDALIEAARPPWDAPAHWLR